MGAVGEQVAKAGAKAARPRSGETLDLRVDRLAHGGAGVARHEGYVVFVDGGLPGDLVRCEITKSRRDYATARALEVLDPGPDRVPGHCDHEGSSCPGSPWQTLRYESQLEAKEGLVADALARLGGLSGFELEPTVAATDIWRYRNKLEYSFGERTGPEGEADLTLGFHARGRWDRIDSVRDCLLASKLSNDVRNLVRRWCAEEGLTAYDRREGRGFLRNLVVREGRRTGELAVRIVTSEGRFRAELLADELRRAHPGANVLWTRTSAAADVSHGGRTTVVAGSASLAEEISGLRFSISPDAFFQTNTEMAERLYTLAAEYAGLHGHERVFDIYCGIGTLSLVLALHAGELWGVDIDEHAIADAVANARHNEIDNAHFVAGDARSAIRPLAERAPRPDVAVVDPPRAGLSKKVVQRLIETGARRIVYVSCNPTTLAPNARQLADAGYRLAKVRPVDMFPHTPHIECVALLERSVDG